MYLREGAQRETAAMQHERQKLGSVMNQFRSNVAQRTSDSISSEIAMEFFIGGSLGSYFKSWRRQEDTYIHHKAVLFKQFSNLKMRATFHYFDTWRESARRKILLKHKIRKVVTGLNSYSKIQTFQFWLFMARTAEAIKAVKKDSQESEGLMNQKYARMQALVRDGLPPPPDASEMELRFYAELANEEMRRMNAEISEARGESSSVSPGQTRAQGASRSVDRSVARAVIQSKLDPAPEGDGK